MPTNNFKLFDEKKANMMTDEEYAINQQRLNGVQSGVASSQLQNKTLYQTALMCYALAQLMAANGYDANDANAVSTFVSNLSRSVVQKVADKATNDDIINKAIGKWVDAAQIANLSGIIEDTYLKLKGGTMTGDLILNRDPVSSLQAATKQYVDKNDIKMQILTRVGEETSKTANGVTVTFDFEPKLVIVVSDPYDKICSSNQSVILNTTSLIYIKGLQRFGVSYLYTQFMPNGRSITFKMGSDRYNPSGDLATWELNQLGVTYYFVAFG